jgi:recombinational DNA repair protein (RecF pathway)
MDCSCFVFSCFSYYSKSDAQLLYFLEYLIDLLRSINNSTNDKSSMDEIVEHLYLCIMKSKPLHSRLFISRNSLILTNVSSNKVKFRLMDILDVI